MAADAFADVYVCSVCHSMLFMENTVGLNLVKGVHGHTETYDWVHLGKLRLKFE